MSLATVVNFTDASGRTSCAKNEREHFRLRCLALSKIASAMKEDARPKRARVAELESTIAEKARFMDDANNVSMVALYQRRLSVLRPIAEAAEGKLARVEQELDALFSATMRNSEVRELCDRTFEKLPAELMDLVCGFIEPYPKVLDVEYIDYKMPMKEPATTQQVLERVYTSDSLNGNFNGKDCETPWYLDANIVGPRTPEAILKVFHRETVFGIRYPGRLERFLNENRWKGFEHLVPKEMVRNIRLKTPPGLYISEPHDVDVTLPPGEYVCDHKPLDGLLESLSPLQSLTQHGVRITLDVRPNDTIWRWLPDHIRSAVANHSSHYGRFGPWEMSTTGDFEIVTRGLLALLLKHLFPFLQDLFRKGHVITIEDSAEKWSWVMSKDNMSVDDVLGCRQAFWDQRPIGVSRDLDWRLDFIIPSDQNVQGA
jgi:hypothetical protein